jgi:hypothetical protein
MNNNVIQAANLTKIYSKGGGGEDGMEGWPMDRNRRRRRGGTNGPSIGFRPDAEKERRRVDDRSE